MNPRLKQIIFNKLYKDLSHVEIIPHKDSIWFIDRENKYWYLIYKKNGILYWRWQFFPNFFNLFSLEQIEFEPIISEWVEEVLNCKVNTPHTDCYHCWNSVEEVINCKVNTPSKYHDGYTLWVEEVLNCKVKTTVDNSWENDLSVKQVLNCKVKIPLNLAITPINFVEEVLNSK